MRKYLVIALALLFMGGVAFGAVGDYVPELGGNTVPGFRQATGPGTRVLSGGTQDVPTKTFRLVRYVPASADDVFLSEDRIVIWNTDPTSGDDGVTVTTTAVTNDSRVAGILATRALTLSPDRSTYTGASRDRGRKNWAFLQTYGPAEVSVGSRAVLVGYAMGTGGGITENFISFSSIGEATYFHPLTGDTGGAEAGFTGFLPDRQGNAGFFMEDGAAAEDDVSCFIKCE